jgi:D-alanine-D-alanine ligase
MKDAQRVAVLFGGLSPERDVSLESGRVVAEALSNRGHAVTLVDPRDQPVGTVDWEQFDAAFIALHGTYGEDGGVQRDLDSLGVVYTGSSAEASAIAFDKPLAKNRFREKQLATPKSCTVSSATHQAVLIEAVLGLRLPVVVKPTCQGSSVGVSIVQSEDQIVAAFAECFRFGSEAIVEQFIDGEEWTVGIIDRRPLPPIRIDAARGFYDYDAKYADERTRFHVADADDDIALMQALQDVSVKACTAIGTSGIARVDLMVDKHQEPWLLEVNTIPGFTSHSLIPKAALACGIDRGELFESVLPTAEQALPPECS